MSRRFLGTVGAMLLTGLVLATAAPVAHAAEHDDPAPSPTSLTERLAVASLAGARGAAELARAVGTPASGADSVVVDASGRVRMDVVFDATPASDQIDALEAIGSIERVYTIVPAVAVSVDPARLPDLEAVEGVVRVAAVVRGASASVPATASDSAGRTSDAPSCREIPVDSDAPLRSDEARRVFGVDGSGITVGILSNSYATSVTAASTPEQDIALGALPGPGNPCGHETPVTVVAEADEPTNDEGRAMAQLVHGIAPGARLMFASGLAGEIGMAQNILDLAQRGADVIVDDIFFTSEPAFQQGYIGYAIEKVRLEYGVAYYTSATNYTVLGAAGGRSAGKPIGAWQTPAYRPTTCPAWVRPDEDETSIDCLDFDPGLDSVPFDELTFAADETVGLPVLKWGESLFAKPFTSFEVRLYDLSTPTPEKIDTITFNDPDVPFLKSALPDDRTLVGGRYALVIVRDLTTGVPPTMPAIWVGFEGTKGDGLTERRFDESRGADVVGRTSVGHAADGSAIGVAAADVKSPDLPEAFTSFGPGTVLFEPADVVNRVPAPALPSPQTVPAPRVAGVDRARTTFLGRESVEDGVTVYRFAGTSAAAPVVAAVHALAQQHVGARHAELIGRAIEETAAPMTNPYRAWATDADVFGAGRADAMALLTALPTPTPEPTPDPTPTPTPSDSPSASPQPTVSGEPGPSTSLPRTGSTVDGILLPAGAVTVLVGAVLAVLARRRGETTR